jgi:adenine-specific DNA-methyltransferase
MGRSRTPFFCAGASRCHWWERYFGFRSFFISGTKHNSAWLFPPVQGEGKRAMNLTDREKELIKGNIDRGEPLPAKYKLTLFENAPEVELIWQGKSNEVASAVLPFQSIEQIDEPRKKAMEQVASLFGADARGRQSSGWTNKLIWGDNKLVLSSLKNGPLHRQIEDAGGLKLIYIDPPFDVGADFSVNIDVGDETLTKEPSVIEEMAYRDTWGRGADSYLSMIFERLRLMHSLLSTDGSIYVHCDWRVNSSVRLVLDEVFGSSRSLNQITWKRIYSHSDANRFGIVDDTLLFYSKSKKYTFNKQFRPHSESYLKSHYGQVDPDGRPFRLVTLSGAGPGPARRFGSKMISPPTGRHWAWSQERIDEGLASGKIVYASTGQPNIKQYLEDTEGTVVQTIWDDIQPVNPISAELLGYTTQKPESLLDRIIKTSSNEGDLIADFFCGSGTTLAVAEKLGRKWIGCDLGRFAIHTARKRLIGVQRELKAEGATYRSFEILNLGKYERQYFVGIDPNLPEELRKAQTIQREEHYLNLILSAYKAERVFQMPPFHGRKGTNLVVVGPIDAPVTLALVNEVLADCRKKKISKVDILGFEFEMGLTPAAQDEAKTKGIGLSLKYIPKDVFDKRAMERGQVQFYDVAYVEALPKVEKMKATVTLRDFGVFYRQDDLNALGERLKPGGSKVTVEGGQVVKVSKDKKEKITREVLTKKWSDWIDYWAVDFHFEDKREIVRLVEDGQERDVWTGNYIFENEWQSFRTRRDRTLELTSAAHTYPDKGRYKIAIKVIDIFGNDTTKVVEVKV